ncbi:isoleucine--tRNA ligase [Sphaerobacter thermophilus]|uniref:Isoleucine--tRNA ligase n=1 Tax=Sphaerobacter thermophilus (strain ATCC 49802 / DSM 20745 / KCCM 41009 / NCIMB 13125 / S 6022) TaxID=479434 RepID=D1C715_SPHTD|nr:isoleucine--tRNA ligase [Sphaerobacter thermophilus]ACZ37776.1 isoleucyl-tRNA synthetase [Sphaerobacter thermophilus DSM 20745]PZN64144.1 MAG: isoleucine--tRNA ligase [Sphaerobacter thermophilus]
MFKPVSTKVDFPAMERETLRWWYESGVVEKYLKRNEKSKKRWSFIDGPITANNPMGVHHAWGRTYKDLYQRFHTMLGERQRYQNGFDCQGLWVEVEVEKELGFTSKQDIEAYGIARFVEKCKERVWKYAAVQTEQSKRLGYFMDWDNSYYTMSDENNYMIWHFLKVCHERGWIYRGADVMPWCPRCATGLSEMEVSEGYQERTHTSLYARFPLEGRDREYLLVWTTTPWTLAANVAAAVHPDLTYQKVKQGDDIYYVAREAVPNAIRGEYEVVGEVKGSDMLGWRYRGPFDELPAEQGVEHRVIPWDAVDAAEGTGIVHIAPGAGREDYQLGKEHNLAVVAPLDENGVYLDGFDWLTGMQVATVAEPIVENLREKGLLYHAYAHTHRYPTCWRCGTDLVFRLVEEWYIAVDPWREQIMEVAKTVRWIPEFGLERELDWLRNMDDWMISKKRYWGLALPIWTCDACGWFDVIGSETELKERAVAGWQEFEGHTPHRPWIDAVKIRCEQCGEIASRIPDVGNPWLDAGIVPFSTLRYRHDREYWREWFPADFITESFPGQFRNWFYSLLAQSTVLVGQAPFRTVLGFATLRDERGEEMHKSKGNAIWFDDAAERMGADVMRWLYLKHNPAQNLNFGFSLGDEARRQFILPLWNSYAFFANYAALDGFNPAEHDVPLAERTLLDRWILSRLQEVVRVVRDRLSDYDSLNAARAIEEFVVEDLSNWYIRRNRRRFWKTESDRDKAAAYLTLHEVLVTVTKLLAPFLPFMTEVMYRNLVLSVDPSAPESVHLTDFPEVDESKVDPDLDRDMAALLHVVGLGRAARARANVKVRQPLPRVLVGSRQDGAVGAIERLKDQLLDELNVKEFEVVANPDEYVTYRVRPNLAVLGPKYGPKLGAIRKALEAADPARIGQLQRAGRPVTLTVDDETVELTPDELLVEVQDREGYSVAEDRDFMVAIDLTITPELRLEGMARDFVRGVQDARKNAGLQIEDTIETVYQATGELAEAIERFADYIKGETLSTDLRPGDPEADGFHREEIKVGKERVAVGITKVGRLAGARAEG